eukprot:TRINITY_DN12719_c0_g2_i2.p1 TRINITY_DN12719_c0_g2~~TRINITY_DN12719_c0_g2_i2.p1  ORF type:complete len:168 (-),score=26.07 TRINITY_DN12719_c0_g2_i2:127-630(-)
MNIQTSACRNNLSSINCPLPYHNELKDFNESQDCAAALNKFLVASSENKEDSLRQKRVSLAELDIKNLHGNFEIKESTRFCGAEDCCEEQKSLKERLEKVKAKNNKLRSIIRNCNKKVVEVQEQIVKTEENIENSEKRREIVLLLGYNKVGIGREQYGKAECRIGGT